MHMCSISFFSDGKAISFAAAPERFYFPAT